MARGICECRTKLSVRTQIGMRACAETGHLGTGASQPGHHDPGHRKIDEGFTAGVRALKIAREATVMRDPGIRTFHHPSPLEHMKASGHDLVPIDGCSFWCPHPAKAGPRMLDDLQTDPEVVLHPSLEGLTGIPAIPPDHLETRQLSSQRREQHLASCPIPDISRQHFDTEQQPLRIHEQMPFSALNFFLLRRSLAHRHARNWF